MVIPALAWNSKRSNDWYMPTNGESPALGDQKSARANSASGRNRLTIRMFSIAVLVCVTAAVVIVNAVRSWTVSTPGVVQVTTCVVLVTGGACWFWAWCGIEGVQAGKSLRQGDRSIDQQTRDSLTAKIEKWERRERHLRRYLPLAVTSALVGFLVLLL